MAPSGSWCSYGIIETDLRYLFIVNAPPDQYLNRLFLLSNSQTEMHRYASMIQDHNDMLSIFDNGPAYSTLRIEFTVKIDQEPLATVRVLDGDERHGAISMDVIVATFIRLLSTKDMIRKTLKRPVEIVGNDKEVEEEEEEEGEICVICQKEYKAKEIMRRLKCGHGYHEECIKEWLLRKNNCPICRDGTVPWLKL